jgi:hypothetical protein
VRISLATAWRPRGEVGRLQRIQDRLLEGYDHLVIVATSDEGLTAAAPLEGWPRTTIQVSPQRFWTRYVAVQTATVRGTTHVHYPDLDLLVRWIEDRPVEWRETLAKIQGVDCLITGRSERAFRTRPEAIQRTEEIINRVGSHFIGQTVDLGLGSRGWSSAVARIVLANTSPGGWGDLEWPIIAQRAGIPVTYVAVDGVDWESPDQFRDEPADSETRQIAAARYDERPASWSLRVRVAHEIIQEGIAALRRPLKESDPSP